MKERGCDRDETLGAAKIMDTVSATLNYTERDYLLVPATEFLGFEYHPEGSAQFNHSVDVWAKALAEWGTIPRKDLIVGQMREVGIFKRKIENIDNSVRNIAALKALLRGYASESDGKTVCDWSWMAEGTKV